MHPKEYLLRAEQHFLEIRARIHRKRFLNASPEVETNLESEFSILEQYLRTHKLTYRDIGTSAKEWAYLCSLAQGGEPASSQNPFTIPPIGHMFSRSK